MLLRFVISAQIGASIPGSEIRAAPGMIPRPREAVPSTTSAPQRSGPPSKRGRGRRFRRRLILYVYQYAHFWNDTDAPQAFTDGLPGPRPAGRQLFVGRVHIRVPTHLLVFLIIQSHTQTHRHAAAATHACPPI